MKGVGFIWSLLRETANRFSEDRATRKAAALAFYTLFSLAPLLIISIAVAGAVFGSDTARAEIIEQMRGLLGDQAAGAIDGMLRNASRRGAGIIAAVTGLATLVFGATTAFAELKQSLDEIWRAPPAATRGLWYTIRSRLLSFGVILTLGFLLLVSLVFSAAVEALQGMLVIRGLAGTLMQAGNLLFSFLMVTALFATLYKMLPSVRLAWSDVMVGSMATAALFAIGQQLIGLYLGHSAVASTYGAAGAVILILLWVYYSALIFLFGAEFTRVWATRRGTLSKVGADAPGTQASPAAR